MAAVKTFGYDASKYSETRTSAEEALATPEYNLDSTLGENTTLDAAISKTLELLSGKLPQDVIDETSQIAAEKGIQSGIGSGQAGGNLVARDLGLSSLDMVTQGLAAATELSAQVTERQTFEKNFDLSYATFLESTRQWEDSFAALMVQTDIDASTLQLQAMELISQNQLAAQQMVNDLIISNSTNAIEDVQSNVDDLLADTFITNDTIANQYGLKG